MNYKFEVEKNKMSRLRIYNSRDKFDFIFSGKVSIPSEHFCIEVPPVGAVTIWDIQRKLPHEKDILSFVLSTWRFHASPVSIFTVHRSRTPVSRRSPAGRNPFGHNGVRRHSRAVAVSHKKRKIEGRVTPALCNLSLRVRMRSTAMARREFRTAVSLSLNYSLTRVRRVRRRQVQRGKEHEHENNKREWRETVDSSQHGGHIEKKIIHLTKLISFVFICFD